MEYNSRQLNNSRSISPHVKSNQGTFSMNLCQYSHQVDGHQRCNKDTGYPYKTIHNSRRTEEKGTQANESSTHPNVAVRLTRR